MALGIGPSDPENRNRERATIRSRGATAKSQIHVIADDPRNLPRCFSATGRKRKASMHYSGFLSRARPATASRLMESNNASPYSISGLGPWGSPVFSRPSSLGHTRIPSRQVRKGSPLDRPGLCSANDGAAGSAVFRGG